MLSTIHITGILLVTIGCVHSGVLPYFPSNGDVPELWELDNLVEPPPNLMMFPHIYNHDRQRAKVPPHNTLKALIKAIYNYEAKHEPGDKKKFTRTDPPESITDSTQVLPSSEESTSSILKSELQTPMIVVSVKTTDNVKPEERFIITDDKEPNQYDETEILTTNNDITSTESLQKPDETTQKPEVLLEDLVDSIIHIPSILSSDKSHKYTHSIRHGYGVPARYMHNR